MSLTALPWARHTHLRAVMRRYQNMRVINGVPEYSGVLNVLSKTVQAEGVLSLWRGFMPYFLRLGACLRRG